LIDPRGQYGKFSIYGDYRYDLAKLLHSFSGKYEFIINDLFSVSKNSRNYTYSHFVSDKQLKVCNFFENILYDLYGNDYMNIQFIEALLFLSMMPIHKDHEKRQLIMLCLGIEKLNKIFEQYV
jgi:hypothetical protein